MDVRFSWLLPDSGHEWKRKGRGRGAQRLVPLSGAIDSKTPGRILICTPPPGLFRKFAALNIAHDELRQQNIRDFADEYGDIIAQPQEGTETVTTHTEIIRKHATLETWCRTIQHMRRAVDLWDRINDPKRHVELERILVRTKDAIIYRAIHHPLENKAGDTELVVLAMGKDTAAYPDRDIIRRARRALQLEVQRALSDIETPSHATPSLTRELRLVMLPDNLLANMWLTFARLVWGEIEERHCTVCPERFYVGSGPGLSRADRVSCSDVCRKRKERQKDQQRSRRVAR